MKIAAYCRVSTDKEEQLDSLIHQKEFFREYAKRNGHALYHLYADEGITGTSLKKREAFKQLMHDAKLGLFEMVVVKDISRFARNTVDALQSIRNLKSMGINTLFLTANMDSMGDSEFVLTLFSAMAQEESHNLSKRVKWGKRINAEKGRVPPRIFGYDRIDKFTLEINSVEAKTVRKIFSLYNEQGLGCRSISVMLNQEGARTKYGGEWNPQGVRRVLLNPIYCGILVNHKYEIADYLTGKQVNIPKEEHFCHERPAWAIVTPEVFRRTQEIMESRRIKYESGESFREGRHSSKHIFSTLIKCEHCGRSFTRKSYTYTNTRVYWRCVTNDQYTAEKCDNHVTLDEARLLEELRKYFSSLIADRESFLASVLADFEKQIPTVSNSVQTISKINARRKKLSGKKARYQDMYANDLISLRELKTSIAAVSEELASLDRDLVRIEESTEIQDLKTDNYRQEITRFLDLETVGNMDMRNILDHISVNKNGNIRIVLKKFAELPVT